MKLNLNQQIYGMDSKPLNLQPDKSKPDKFMTLKDVCVESCLIPEEKDTTKEKYDKYDLYKKFNSAGLKGIVELSIDETALIKKLIETHKPVLIMGQACEMLEEATVEDKPKIARGK